VFPTPLFSDSTSNSYSCFVMTPEQSLSLDHHAGVVSLVSFSKLFPPFRYFYVFLGSRPPQDTTPTKAIQNSPPPRTAKGCPFPPFPARLLQLRIGSRPSPSLAYEKFSLPTSFASLPCSPPPPLPQGVNEDHPIRVPSRVSIVNLSKLDNLSPSLLTVPHSPFLT